MSFQKGKRLDKGEFIAFISRGEFQWEDKRYGD